MNWIPPVLSPLDPTMLLLLTCWILAVSLALHRATRYSAQRRDLRRRHVEVEQVERAARSGSLPLRINDALVESLCRLIRDHPSARALERFHERRILPERRPDKWNDRALLALVQIPPLLGLIGTVVGILFAFAGLAEREQMTTLKDLAGPVSLALRTTLYGAICSVFCIAIRASFPTADLQKEADRLILHTWEILRALIYKQPPEKRKATQPRKPQAATAAVVEKKEQENETT